MACPTVLRFDETLSAAAKRRLRVKPSGATPSRAESSALLARCLRRYLGLAEEESLAGEDATYLEELSTGWP